MKFRLLILLLSFVFGCSNQKEASFIRVEGNITSLPDTKLYLVDAKKWKTPVDSAECKDGHFVFHVKTDSSFYPWMAAIHFINNGDIDHPQRFQFRNQLLGADSLQYLRDAFYIEPGGANITGRYGSSPWLRISAGIETELYFQNQFTDIGWMGDKDSVKRNNKMNLLKEAIAAQPGSFFLLQSIFGSKEQYSREELITLLNFFNDTIRRSGIFKQFSDYLSVRPGRGEAYPVILLKAPDDKAYPLIDSTAGVNMLVFWASWCMPCRKEIPQLKTLYQKYSGKGVRFVSISIDIDKEQWRHALRQERLPWQQFLIEKEKIETIENIFNFTTIPFVVFTDNNGKELGRISDYDPENAARYDSVLKKYSR